MLISYVFPSVKWIDGHILDHLQACKKISHIQAKLFTLVKPYP
jgi:hypothetical protein